MQRLVYTSSARHNLKQSHIGEILTAARENNRKLEVTGLLILHEGTFLQVLEGEAQAVSSVFSRISRDWRHTHCKVLMNETVVDRLFSDWSMAFRLSANLQARQIRQLQDIQTVVSDCEAGAYMDHPALNVFLRAFLSGVRMLDAA